MKKLSLYDYLQQTDEVETTVHDIDYCIETYFYKREPEDTEAWSINQERLSRLLTITEFEDGSVEVDLSRVIDKNIQKLKEIELFSFCDTESIMEDIESILSGNVSDEWFEKFVNCLQ